MKWLSTPAACSFAQQIYNDRMRPAIDPPRMVMSVEWVDPLTARIVFDDGFEWSVSGLLAVKIRQGMKKAGDE